MYSLKFRCNASVERFSFHFHQFVAQAIETVSSNAFVEFTAR
jgi:hypothetical protein